MEDNQKFELTEALAKWVLAESKKVNFSVKTYGRFISIQQKRVTS